MFLSSTSSVYCTMQCQLPLQSRWLSQQCHILWRTLLIIYPDPNQVTCRFLQLAEFRNWAIWRSPTIITKSCKIKQSIHNWSSSIKVSRLQWYLDKSSHTLELWKWHSYRAGFKGGPGGPRPPTNRGPPTKPFTLQIFLFLKCVCVIQHLMLLTADHCFSLGLINCCLLAIV